MQARPFVAKLEPGETEPDLLDAKALLEMDEAALASWVADNRLPTFSMLDRENFWELSQNPSRPLALFMLDPCNGTACDATLGPEAATSLIGAEMRRISRDPKFRHKFYFGCARLPTAIHPPTPCPPNLLPSLPAARRPLPSALPSTCRPSGAQL